MKYIFGIVLWVALPLLAFAQTNAPVKLALIAESDNAAAAVDVLTAQLSSDSRFQLLERDEIDKVYHEQGLSVANRNDLKLGRILGADGLLLLKVGAIPQPSFAPASARPSTGLTARLIAVKPGIILTEGTFQWPATNAAEWSRSAAAYISSFLPKLTVSAGAAIPVSVVNLRSAIKSSEAAQTEHELKMLAIQRLSQEPQIFVLERQKMQLLAEEKDLNADTSAFWDGSYLLEGTIDQNGFSPDVITINGRLIPPRGAPPLLFEVSGSRTNLAEVINALAIRVTELLNIHSSITSWNAAAEASRYLDEANWALKWGMNDEAQAASESAWALGKRSLDCALIRVRSYVADIPKVEPVNAQHYASMEDYYKKRPDPHYVPINNPPNPDNLDRALYALGAYEQFCKNSADGRAEVLSRPHWNDWHDSDWYRLGVDSLTAASQVLQQYWFHPESRGSVEDKLADLRAVTRSLAQFISQSSSVHDGYFVGDRITTRDELSHTIEESPNIFRCEVNWGCFWQERPQDAISLYRELMSSPVFCYIHSDFWSRTAIQPRLIAWNEEDGKNVPLIWKAFVGELNDSTNILWQMEAKALMKTDATNDEQAKAADAAWWSIVRSNRDELVGNNVELFYLGWKFAYNPETEAMDEEYWQKTVPAGQTTSTFEQQKQYLENFTRYDFQTFVNLFQSKNYSRAQAFELKPLIAAYESNVVATASASAQQLFFAKANVQWIDLFLEKPIDEILNPPAQAKVVAAKHPPATPPGVARPVQPVAATVSTTPEEIPSNILRVTDFIKIPEQKESNDMSGDRIFARRWSDGKLLFGLVRDREVYDFDTNGNWIDSREAASARIAIFNPVNETWDFVKYSQGGLDAAMLTLQDNDNRIILFHGRLFSSVDGSIREFDFQSQDWQALDVPDQDGADLFSVGDRLYAASDTSFLDITDPGNIRILASTRRRPAVTALDSLDTFAIRADFSRPRLFDGADGSLCASVGSKIYRWDGKDWQEILNMNISRPPEVFDGGVILRNVARYGSDDRSSLWLWDKSQDGPKLCLSDKPQPHPGIINSPFLGTRSAKLHPAQQTQPVHAQWESLPDDYLTSAVATIYDSNFYFLVDHADVKRDNSGHWNEVDKNGYDAKLVCLTRDLATPVVVPLKFDTTRAQPPLRVLGQEMTPELMFDPSALDATLHFAGDSLYFNQRNLLGVWAIRVSELESAIAAIKQNLIARIAQEKAEQGAARENIRRQLLARYDRNHNGTIDPDEREEALDDPDYIESELDKIDANHDGLLEANELFWFDANQNKILDPKEAAGINIAQHLLAVRLMKKFDADGKGYLSQSEFSDLKESCTGVSDRTFFVPQLPGRYLGPRIDLQGVEDFLKGQTMRSLRLPGSNAAVMNQLRVSAGAVDKTQVLKLEVEYYWAHSGGQTH